MTNEISPHIKFNTALARANSYRMEAINKPDDAGLYNGLADFVIECLKEEEDG